MKAKNTYLKKSILLFGGCGKLGKYIIENLHIENDQSELYILDLNQPKINDNFKSFNFIQCDANNVDELTEKIAGLIHKSSQLTVINLIGFDFPVNKNAMQYDSPVSISQDALRKSLELNLETSHMIVQSVIKFEKQSHFIFFSSIYASKPTNSNLYKKGDDKSPKYKPFIYGAAKAGLEKFSNDLSTYLPLIKSRVNTISLGGINLDLPEEFVERYSDWSPQKSMISPNSLVNLLSWLIFDSPQELNGCVLKLDGGLSNT